MPFLRALPRSDRSEEMASFEGIQAMNSLAAHIRSHIAPEEHGKIDYLSRDIPYWSTGPFILGLCTHFLVPQL
jgi:hypothetical protein